MTSPTGTADHGTLDLSVPAGHEPWRNPSAYWPDLSRAVAHLSAPVAVLGLEALRWNTHDLLRRAGGTPLRVASKSLRVRGVINALLALPGFRGILAFTLAEALWLAERCDDVVVGYPSTDRAALARLLADHRLAARVTLMIDDEAQLDLIDSLTPAGRRPEVRICLDADASWRSPLLGFIGTRRSPLHAPADAVALGRAVASRPGFTLVGLMMYEGQIAGVGDAAPRAAAMNALMRRVQPRSIAELRQRRGTIVRGLRELADLEFVNGGGTGSVESTAADPSVTEITAGSGLFAGHLFDSYRAFSPAPAAAVALDVVRRPAPAIATVLGGGWIASGPPGANRVPQVAWPRRLKLLPREGAGEVQTPLAGRSAAGLAVGDRVWFRHAKSGEPAERVNSFAVVDGGTVTAMLPTYRGEGKAFL
ncbi:alanine racemase [Arthrobacter jiangjiafuii]|uniref:Alanine racemase n=1 Tax=Arthrobacter jiangjiafuii TaxID=2817475 RepID=A0A975M323_9MICC|nr:alanine racemase [Arthrobacter jiangjiafuii]MBP3043468.1 alanine racemase [Arthrobacter jiangjiafuii]QWC08992.1 alanine racemase [Arthrobacter jiangjiafuii]